MADQTRAPSRAGQADGADTKRESTASAFLRYQQSAASRLRYALAQSNMERLHAISGKPLTVLDAPGGNGINTEFLLRTGHAVTLFDVDRDMIEQARAHLGPLGLLSRCRLVEGDLDQVADVLPRARFDLVVCHHAIEYLKDVPRVLRALRGMVAPGGELSLVSLNPVSEVVRSIVFNHDPSAAKSKLGNPEFDAKWFGSATLYAMDRVLELATGAGWTMLEYRGIRALADYMPASRLTPAKEAELLRLEEELSGLDPFRRFGRYLQYAFRA